MKQERGFSLISALVGMLIFTFGMLSLASAYLKVNANMDDNEYFTSAGMLAESLRSSLSASPSLRSGMSSFSSANVTTQTPAPIIDWVSQLSSALPGAVATATAKDPTGASCTAVKPCTVSLIITWQRKLSHSQSFVLQVGY